MCVCVCLWCYLLTPPPLTLPPVMPWPPQQLSLQQEIQRFQLDAQRQRQVIIQLEKDRDRHINDAAIATQTCMQVLRRSP